MCVCASDGEMEKYCCAAAEIIVSVHHSRVHIWNKNLFLPLIRIDFKRKLVLKLCIYFFFSCAAQSALALLSSSSMFMFVGRVYHVSDLLFFVFVLYILFHRNRTRAQSQQTNWKEYEERCVTHLTTYYTAVLDKHCRCSEVEREWEKNTSISKPLALHWIKLREIFSNFFPLSLRLSLIWSLVHFASLD